MTHVDIASPRRSVTTSRGTVMPLVRSSTVTVAVIAMTLLVFLILHVMGSGYGRRDVITLAAGQAWRSGAWMSELLLQAARVLPPAWQQAGLIFVAAILAGLLCGALYHRLRAHGWLAWEALAVLSAAIFHVGALYTLTATSMAIPMLLAVAAIIPAIRALEDVGDVQAAIGLSLLLPLLLLAGPLTAILIVPIGLGAALADPDGRRDPRAFIALLLVTLLPTVIVGLGIVGFLAQAKLNLAATVQPYVDMAASFRFGDLPSSLAVLFAYTPALLVPVAYCFWPSLPGGRRALSAAAVVVVPIYFATARVMVDAAMAPAASAAFLTALLSWLAVVRLPRALRLVTLLLVATSTLLSWVPHEYLDDPVWKAALLNVVPQGIAGFELRPGV